MAVTTPPLFALCPLPGCHGVTADPREPCEDCKAAFGEYLRPPKPGAGRLSPDEYTAVLAQRDADVRAVLTERLAPVRLESAAAPEPRVQWRRNQHCWVCDEQPRSCRPNPGFPGRWICRACYEEEPA